MRADARAEFTPGSGRKENATALRDNQAPLPGKIAALLRESKWFIVIAAALYVALILFSFDKADPGWSHAAATSEIRNAGGRVGAWLSDILLYLFGVSAWWSVLLFFYAVVWGYRRLDGSSISDRRPFIIALIGFAILLIASSGLEALRLYSIKATLPLMPGGMLGAVVAEATRAQLGFTGSTLVLLTLCAIGLSLLTGISWLTVAEVIGAGLERLYVFAVERWQQRQDRKAGEVATVEREAIVEVKRVDLIEDHEPIRITAPVIEIPKSVRVQKEKQAPLFQDLPDTPLPPLKLLDEPTRDVEVLSSETLEYTSRLIEKKLGDFGVQAKVLAAYPGPVITRFEIEPAVGVKGNQIISLAKDLARALSVISIRVVETIPGKSCMGLEIPNPHRQIVRLSEILSSEVYHSMGSPLTLALGKDIAGNPIVADLSKMPHLLVAGTTGSGKSVAINAMILSLLYKSEPREVRLIMVDPKMLELSIYQDIPHLLAPVVTDMKQAANALVWCVAEMDRRYKIMSWVGVRNLSGYNHKIADAEKSGNPLQDPNTLESEEPQPLAKLPHIVVVIDELADLMMVTGKKVEELIARLAQKARAAGIHLILATQRPSVDVITGLIKANIPTRIAFQVSSKVDSRTILDQQGAEALLGQGDMLYLPPGTGVPLRVHGAYVADQEVHSVVDYLKALGKPDYVERLLEEQESNGAGELGGGEGSGEADPLYDQAVEIVLRTRRASI
ncbi:MAG: DNA translocase FtsK 4TM domain-containing protein, partial [Betaproteobacteria bacterium]|nr:DNA translocase FtsK 4TM domain-containing protein [Betaproteobacteria bacterium]